MPAKRPRRIEQVAEPQLPEAVQAWAGAGRHMAPIERPDADPVPVQPEPVVQGLTAHESLQAAKLIQEAAKRRIEGLKLYESLHYVEPFHLCTSPERVLRGSNQAGKTLGAAVEFARAVTRQDPAGKYPAEGIAYCVGKDLRHCGKVMYSKLFRAGAYRIIRDEATGLWRTFRPWVPSDSSRRQESRPAPPLIPHRFVKSISWENKAAGIPNLVTLHTGWEIAFFSSEGKPPQGTLIDIAWFDEEIKDGDWYPEISARLMTKRGRFWWSATPQTGTEQLYDLHERAELEADRESPTVVEFICLLDDNTHIDQDQKKQLSEKLGSDEERRVRIMGEFAIVSQKVYAEFSQTTHGVKPFEVPYTWSAFAVTDPGRRISATLFAAVAPPEVEEWADRVVLFDELYLKDCNAQIYGEAMKKKCGDRPFVAFVIDRHGSRVTEAGSGKSVESQYSDALRDQGISSMRTNSGYTWGSDDVDAGILAVKNWMRIRGEQEDFRPRLAVFYNLFNFHEEIKRYRNARDKFGEVTDKPLQRNNHLMDCLRYLAMYNPKYVPPIKGKAPVSYAVRALQAKRERQRAKTGQKGVHLGPGKR